MYQFYLFIGCMCSMQDLSSLTRDRAWLLALGAWSLNHWTTRDGPLCTTFEQVKSGWRKPHGYSVLVELRM